MNRFSNERRTAYARAGAEAGTKTHAKQGPALTATRESAATTRRMQRQRYPVVLLRPGSGSGICSKHGLSAPRLRPRGRRTRTPARDREARSACGVLLPASAIRHVFLVVVSTPKRKASLAPRCLCLPIMPAGLRARPSAVTLSPVAPRPAPPGETPAFSVDATLGTGHAPSSQHGTAGGRRDSTAARRARAAGRRTQRHVCVAAHHGSSSRLADRSNPTGTDCGVGVRRRPLSTRLLAPPPLRQGIIRAHYLNVSPVVRDRVV